MLRILIASVVVSTALSAQGVPKTMLAKLKADSLENGDAYYYRINKVKSVTIQGEEDKEVQEIDKFGQVTKLTSWSLNMLDYMQEYTYDNFGNEIERVSIFYDDNGKPESVYSSETTYEIDPSGLTEREAKSVSVNKFYENGNLTSEGSSTTFYAYDAQGRLSSITENGVVAYCTEGPRKFKEFTKYEYNEKGQVESKTTRSEGGCDEGVETEIVSYTYDSLGREVKSIDKVNGKFDGSIVTSYNSAGQEERWTYYNEERENYMSVRFQYNHKGLKVSEISTYEGEKDDADYVYTYY